MKPKVAKFIAKQGVGAIITLAIGIMVKFEKRIEARIDEHYAEPKKTDQEDN